MSRLIHVHRTAPLHVEGNMFNTTVRMARFPSFYSWLARPLASVCRYADPQCDGGHCHGHHAALPNTALVGGRIQSSGKPYFLNLPSYPSVAGGRQ